MNKERRLPSLPPSNNEYWEDAEMYNVPPRSIEICSTHTKYNWTTHEGYTDNKDGTISCQLCPWGARINLGRYRVLDGKIVDLRSPISL